MDEEFNYGVRTGIFIASIIWALVLGAYNAIATDNSIKDGKKAAHHCQTAMKDASFELCTNYCLDSVKKSSGVRACIVELKE